MYIIAPLILIVISLVGIAFIVRRKLSYLRKLSPDAHAVSEHLFEDYFPELIGWFREFKWQEYQQASLREIEKGLRRLRLVVMKVDHVSEGLIKKVRKIHLTNHLEQASVEIPAESPAEVSQQVSTPLDDLKAREQELIVGIAQDPKNPENAKPYEELGDIYLKMGNVEDAREAYEAALGFNLDNLVVARKYSALLKKDQAEG